MLLEVAGLSKRFHAVTALEAVDFAADAGEVHALVGANGAGKSTLMNLLSGVFQPSAGEIRIDGTPVVFDTPRKAVDCGIITVYQEFSSIGELTVAENIFLGREPTHSLGVLDRKTLRAAARALLDKFHIDLDPDAVVEDLTVAHVQLVEIARALSVEARVLILDEPTAVLSLREQENLFAIIEILKQQGMLILYVSHRMEEIFSISDRVTVLRDGRHVATMETSATDRADVIALMIGREIDAPTAVAQAADGEVVLAADLGAAVGQFTVRRGEILGIAGLVGAGRTRLARRLVGLEDNSGTQITLHGQTVTPKSPDQALRHGIVYLTEDRKRDGLFGNLSILQNTTAASLDRFTRAGFLQRVGERAEGAAILKRLHLVAGSLDRPVGELSGGNQQKVVFGRAMLCTPQVLICDEPTRGVDVGAKQEIFRLLGELAGQGVAVIFISSELKELLATAHRLLILHEGRIVDEVATADTNEEKLLRAASGMAA